MGIGENTGGGRDPLMDRRYRLLYEVTQTEVHILAFIHGARDLTGSGFEGCRLSH
jgi:hypothetical protein